MRAGEVGKVGRSYFDRVIYPRLGAQRKEVLVGPTHGVDNAVIKIGGGQVIITTTDPLSIVPSLGLKDSAWLSVHLLASDIATSGFPPSYAVLELNLPPEIGGKEFEIYWNAVHQEFKKIGVAIVGGHTGRYIGCGYTIVGGGMLMAIGSEEKYLTSSMVSPGDKLVMTKTAAIAATAVLSRSFPNRIREKFGKEFLTRAQQLFYSFSTMDDALSSASIGVREAGVTAMHDVTEGGVLGAIWEICNASNVGVNVNLDYIPISEEAKAVCHFFRIDPLRALGEGTLLIAVNPHRTTSLMHALSKRGIQGTEIGTFLHKKTGLNLVRKGGTTPLRHQTSDPYWKAFWNATQQGYT